VGALIAEVSGTVFTTGDNVYPDGTAAEFTNCYDPAWGELKTRTRPSPGNHDYHVPGASGYFGYFGSAAGPAGQGYYAYDLGTWRIYSLNSEMVSTAQVNWLESDLAANPASCVLAYWHHPRFSSGRHGSDDAVAPFWDALHAAGAEVVVNGHDHNYERFAPQTPSGQASTTGIREFVVGTGGANQRPFEETQPNSEKRMTGTWGALKLTLESGSYSWEFLPASGPAFSDAGTSTCH
jgi:acid phosphatase type 7